MKPLIVIPVRGIPPSKTRLAGLFDEQQRIDLVRAMLAHMLGQMPAGIDVAVITRSFDQLADVPDRVTVIQQDPNHPGLNGSLQQALKYAHNHGYSELLMLPGDLPLLSTSDVTDVLLEEGHMVIVGDRDQQGTNGLRLPTAWSEQFTFAMGEGSFRHHIAEAHRQGTVPVTVYHRGLAHDLDTPDDWLALPEEVRERLLKNMAVTAKGA